MKAKERLYQWLGAARMHQGSKTKQYHIIRMTQEWVFEEDHTYAYKIVTRTFKCSAKERLYAQIERRSMLNVIRNKRDRICPECWAEMAKQLVNE